MYMFQNFRHLLGEKDISFGQKVCHFFSQYCYESENETNGQGTLIVMGPDYRLHCLHPDEYDREYRSKRAELWIGIGWPRCLHLGELLQGLK